MKAALRLRRTAQDESAQDSFEYLLVVGIAVVALFVGLLGLAEVIPIVAGHTCESVDTAADPEATTGSCINETP